MKNVIGILLIGLTTIACCKQDIKKQEVRIVMLGDSMTNRMHNYSTWKEEMDKEVFSVGYDGFKSANILNGYLNIDPLQEVSDLRPNLVFLMIGVNDIHNNQPLQETLSNIQTICDTLRKEEVQVVVQSVLPPTLEYDTQYGGFIASKVEVLNDSLQVFCQQNNYEFIDLRSQLADGTYLIEEYTTDGLHLNYKGYKVWSKIIK